MDTEKLKSKKEESETEDLQSSMLVGEFVLYSITKQENSTGIILDKISKKDKTDDQFSVTGYMIKDDVSGKIVNVSYWRILETLTRLDPRRPLPGGYKK